MYKICSNKVMIYGASLLPPQIAPGVYAASIRSDEWSGTNIDHNRGDIFAHLFVVSAKRRVVCGVCDQAGVEIPRMLLQLSYCKPYSTWALRASWGTETTPTSAGPEILWQYWKH